ncbi:MAG TPA: uroporphyrinogen decarboxylase family protein, partial [Clostridia bacterium]
PDIVEPLLKDVSQIDSISFDGIMEDEDINVLSDTTRKLNEIVGDRTLVGSSQWGPFTLAGHVYGVERLMRNIYKDKKAVHAVLEFTTELCARYLERFVEAGAGIISIADPTSSGDLISREQFREFSLPYLKKAVQRINEKGSIVSIHICGNITNRLDLIPETGAKNISVDYKVDISKARELLAGKIAFSGNMNPVAVMQNETPDGVEISCRECIKKAGDRGYILMPGCDIPPGVPVENIVRMVEIALDHTYRS